MGSAVVQLRVALFVGIVFFVDQYARLNRQVQDNRDALNLLVMSSTTTTTTTTTNASQHHAQQPGDASTSTHHDKSFERFLSFPTAQELESSCPPRLEFLHIPKTGGTTVEHSASAQANLTWGACHFHLNLDKRQKPWGICPASPLQTPEPLDQWPRHEQLIPMWHYPLHWLESGKNQTSLLAHPLPSNPYHNLASGNPSGVSARCPPQQQALHFFVIVRHPYDRAISEFYYHHGFNPVGANRLEDPQFLNQWISEQLQQYQQHLIKSQTDPHLDWRVMSHWIPQYDFVLDPQGHRRVRHVLRYENVTAEFDELMQRYQLNVTLSSNLQHKSGKVPKASRLGPANLTSAVRAQLERHFALDFELGGYDRIVGSQEEDDTIRSSPE